jgi:hypothetical protein
MAGRGAHLVTVRLAPTVDEVDDERYELECECCGSLGSAGGLDEARAIVRVHERFVAVLVDAWEI